MVSSGLSALVGRRTPSELTVESRLPSAGHQLLLDLLQSGLVSTENWESLPSDVRAQLNRESQAASLLETLVFNKLLTPYQADRVAAGKTDGMILGNYRVIDRIGAGGMGVVFKAEHQLMRRLAAIKVLPLYSEEEVQPLLRFMSEMRTLSRLYHPNIVAALDGGKFVSQDPGAPNLYYLVMEYVAGENLESIVYNRGPMAVPRACDIICQVASALVQAQKLELIHRDIKPSNIILTPEGQAKLLDFGLARHYQDPRLTKPGSVLGTVDYMAPEQARDASHVDIRADIYALGGTLFWCLAAQTPFAQQDEVWKDLLTRQTQPAPSIRTIRPEISEQLDRVIQRMMAMDPNDRYGNPQSLITALLPFLPSDSSSSSQLLVPSAPVPALTPGLFAPSGQRTYRILAADDDPRIREILLASLQSEGWLCDVAADGGQAREAILNNAYDLALVDVNMPVLDGLKLVQELRKNTSVPYLKVILLSGGMDPDEMASNLANGADDFLTKPFSLTHLRARVRAALALKDAQDRSEQLNRHLLTVNAELEKCLNTNRHHEARARNGILFALAELAELRTGSSSAHLLRMQRYVRSLAERAMQTAAFQGQIQPTLIDMLECLAPLHDIGQVGLPDNILQSPNKLGPDDRMVMQTHTILGADILQRNVQRHGAALAFLQMGIDIIRHHHERYDGTGYPDRLSGNAIPLAARIVALADVYDALRSRRHHRPALSHPLAVQIMTAGSPGHFDPLLLEVFKHCAGEFEQAFRETPDLG